MGAALALLAIRLFSVLPNSYSVDSWLELTAGRLVWNTGIPHHETMTAMASGRAWVDQQWLSQLASYGLYRVGGLALLGVVNVALLISGLGIAALTARRLGASTRAVLIASVVCAWLVVPAIEVRTQAFALPLFSLTVYLLARDSRAPSWSVFWTLPVLVLWGNLHGSASMGAVLITLRGLTLAWERRKVLHTSLRGVLRPLALVVLPPLALLVTPYGLSTISYYRSTLGNGVLRQMVSEWQPVTSDALIAVPFFIVAAAMIWSWGRDGARSRLWERLALLALAAGTIDVIRDVTLFAIAALALLPLTIDGLVGPATDQPPRVRRRVNGAVVTVAAVMTMVAVIATLRAPDAHFDHISHRGAMLGAIESRARANPGMRIWTDTRYSDWLLWHARWLSGRIATDARFEMYTVSQLRGYERFVTASGTDWMRSADGYRLLVLDRAADGPAIKGVLGERGARVLYTNRDVIVILRAAGDPSGSGSTS